MHKINGVKVTPSQAAVYDVLATYGPLPDHALVPLAQHVEQTHQSSSGIRTRRRELLSKGLVVDSGRTVRTGSNRKAAVYEAV